MNNGAAEGKDNDGEWRVANDGEEGGRRNEQWHRKSTCWVAHGRKKRRKKESREEEKPIAGCKCFK